ncbi:OmpA family protein [Desulfonatronum thioautotrophicum]|uniref:OmpA family protein n=1 Tax=Desulfonatronum thioautotrophicum TaxID=617001 RepID=UPI0005EB3DC6|nr:OmpA family protein [Desulfonatronum thioautotrophicum]
MTIHNLFGKKRSNDEGFHWLSVGDLMAGLMMIFLFIAITYMRMVVIERDRVMEVIVAWDNTQEALYESLYEEFKNDLEKWNAEIEKETLSVRFREPDVLFQQGQSDLQETFQLILQDFFPRYIRELDKFSSCDPSPDGKPRGCVEEVRIEGHTSSEWSISVSQEEAYFLNMALSQGRTRSVLQYCLSLDNLDIFEWLHSRISAVGFSSSRPIFDNYGNEDKKLSRRVEFRVRTTVERELMRIIKD